MPEKYFRKLNFKTIDNKRIEWNLSYMCDRNNGTVYLFEYDSALSAVPKSFSIPLVNNAEVTEKGTKVLKSVPYQILKDDVAQKVTDNFGTSVGSIKVDENGVITINNTIQTYNKNQIDVKINSIKEDLTKIEVSMSRQKYKELLEGNKIFVFFGASIKVWNKAENINLKILTSSDGAGKIVQSIDADYDVEKDEKIFRSVKPKFKTVDYDEIFEGLGYFEVRPVSFDGSSVKNVSISFTKIK